jgi:hypothetical protein
MNLNDLYETRDPRDAYERDVANSTSGFGKDSQAYRADGGANDERHDLDQQSSTWYIRLNGKLIRDKSGNPYAFQDKAAANKAARTMQAKLFNKDKEFMLTTNPNDKSQGVAEAGSNDVEEFLHKVARSGDNGFDMLYNAQQGKYGREIEQSIQDMYDDISIDTGYHGDDDFEQIYDRMLDNIEADYGQQGVTETQQLSVQQLATISDAALDKAYGYGRSQPGNSFGWQANLKSAAFAKQIIDKGVTEFGDTAKFIEAISDAIHKGWNTTAQAFVQNPEQFDDTAKLKAAGKLEAKLQQRAQLMKQKYGELPEEEKEKDRVVARALLQALKGDQGVGEGYVPINIYKGPPIPAPEPKKVERDLPPKYDPKVHGEVHDLEWQRQQMEKRMYNVVRKSDGKVINPEPIKGYNAAEEFRKQNGLAYWDTALKEISTLRFHVTGVDSNGKVVNSEPLLSMKDVSDFYKQHGINQFVPTTRVTPTGGGVEEDNLAEGDVDSDGYSMDHADSGEYDYEGDQAKDQLNTIVRAARRLNGMLDDNENMPEWVQMKITNAADYIDTAADYIESNQEPELEEDWRKTLGAAALTGAMALGAGGAQARVMPGDDPGINRLTGKPIATQQATDTAPTQSTSSINLAKPQAQYDVDTRILTYKGKQYKWNSDAQATGQGEVVTAPSIAVGSRSMGSTKVELNPNGTYTRAPANESQEKVGNMDADEFDSAMARLKQLAGAGPMKTVYDPTKRVYRNVPVAVQPKK